MKKSYRIAIFLTICIILIVGWIVRYVSLNIFYDKFSTLETQVYSIGTAVPFDDDFMDLNIKANGYTLQVDRFIIVDYLSVLDQLVIDSEVKNERNHPEKLALVYVTLENTNGKNGNVVLTEFGLHGIDQNAFLDWDMLNILNPMLDGVFSVTLPMGENCNLIIPYALRERNFSAAWNSIDEYSFYFQITAFPTVKRIQVQ